MSSFWTVLQEVFLRLKLFVFGVRFYERGNTKDVPVIREAEYRIDKQHRIRFKFSKVECFDISMRRNHLTREGYSSFIVQAFLDESFPDNIRVFDGKSFFFNGMTNNFSQSDERTMELILDVYLDFLKKSLDKEHATVEVNQAT